MNSAALTLLTSAAPATMRQRSCCASKCKTAGPVTKGDRQLVAHRHGAYLAHVQGRLPPLAIHHLFCQLESASIPGARCISCPSTAGPPTAGSRTAACGTRAARVPCAPAAAASVQLTAWRVLNLFYCKPLSEQIERGNGQHFDSYQQLIWGFCCPRADHQPKEPTRHAGMKQWRLSRLLRLRHEPASAALE